MDDLNKSIKKIDAKKFKRKIRAHSLWNSEGVIELFNSMLIKEDKEKADNGGTHTTRLED